MSNNQNDTDLLDALLAYLELDACSTSEIAGLAL